MFILDAVYTDPARKWFLNSIKSLRTMISDGIIDEPEALIDKYFETFCLKFKTWIAEEPHNYADWFWERVSHTLRYMSKSTVLTFDLEFQTSV